MPKTTANILIVIFLLCGVAGMSRVIVEQIKKENSDTVRMTNENRPKRSIGVNGDNKREIELKTRKGSSLKITRTRVFSDGGAAAHAPDLINSIVNGEAKILKALIGDNSKRRPKRGATSYDPNMDEAGLKHGLKQMTNLFLIHISKKNPGTDEMRFRGPVSVADIKAGEALNALQTPVFSRVSRFLAKAAMRKNIGAPCCPDKPCCPNYYYR